MKTFLENIHSFFHDFFFGKHSFWETIFFKNINVFRLKLSFLNFFF